MSRHLSRRGFIGLSAAAAGLASLPSNGAAPGNATAPGNPTAPVTVAAPGGGSPSGGASRVFPAGFLWGSATAAYQIEGAVEEDGRGPSIWDTFAHTRGKTHDGDTGDVADDSYHRYPEDIALMQALGLKASRFSISWSRIFPRGRGKPESKGIDHYRRYAEALRAAGMEPYCTLYHWDLPQTLEDEGGWQNRDTAQAFADYAGYVARQLSDVIPNFMTMNEIRSFIELGYGTGVHAPGLRLGAARLAQARHHAVLGHGLAVQAIRAAAHRGTRVGSAENPWPVVPMYDSPEQVTAARTAMREENAGYLTVMHTGRYTDAYLARLGADAPRFTDAELKSIASPVDFQGLNLYQPSWVRADEGPKGYALIDDPASYPTMASTWLTVGPETLYWVPKISAEIFDLRSIYVTENGASSQDTVSPDGHIYDTDRTMYLRNCLSQLQRAVSEGIPILGYFLWSLLDNFEWSDGYAKRFGITYVDFKTLKRTPKLSSHFYKEVIRRNGLA